MPNEYDDLLAEGSDTSPRQPASSGNEYDAILAADHETQKTALKGAMFVGTQTTPDRAAQVQDLAARTKLPTSLVERNYDEIAKRNPVAETDYDGLITKTPGLAKFLESPDNAAVAHDDLPALGKVEQDVQDHSMMTTMYKSLVTGMSQMNASLAKVPALAYDIAATPHNLIAGTIGTPDALKSPDWLIKNPVSAFYDDQAKLSRPPELEQSITGEIGQGNYKRAGMALAAQFVANSPQQAAIIALTLSGYGAAALTGAGATTAADANAENRAAGVDPTTGVINAVTKGSIESGFESLGTFGVLKHWENAIAKQWGKQVSGEVFRDFGKTLSYSFAAEGNEEALTSIAQDFADYVTGVNPDALSGMAQRAADAGIIGGASGGGMTAPSATLAGMARGAQIRQTTLAKDFYLALGQSAEGTKLRERLPEKQRQYVEHLTKGGPVENVYLPIDGIETYFQAAKLNPTAVMQEIGALAEYTDAKETGTDVRIPLATWIDKVVGTEHFAGLANDVKFDPNALTVNEQKATDEQAKAELEQQAKDASISPETQDGQAPAEGRRSIGTQVTDQLKAAGRNAHEAHAGGVLNEAIFNALGQRTGQDPHALFDRYNLHINGPEQAQDASGDQVLNQPRPIEEDLATRNSPNPLPAQVPVHSIATPDRSFDGLAPKELRKAALDEAKTLPRGDVTNTAEGWKISISGEGLKKSANYAVRPDQAVGLRNLRELIAKAHYVRTETRGDQPAHDYLYSPFEHDGKSYLAKIVVENVAARGGRRAEKAYRKFYSLHVQKVKRSPEGQTIRLPGAEAQSSERSIPLQDFLGEINQARETTENFQGGDDPLGRIRIGKGGINIDLLKDANASTAFHEFGHLYLEVMGDLATAAEAPEQIKGDYQTILNWLGVSSREEIKTEQHEKWARGFEAYLMEGKAPTSALRQAFAQFKVWLIDVYKKLTALNVQLSPEIRDVMARMMATEEQIAVAEHAQGFTPLFGANPETFGMTGKKGEDYTRAVRDARLTSEETVNRQLMEDFERQRSAWWAEQRKALRPEFEAQANNMRVYQALAGIQKGERADGTPLNDGEKLKLSKDAIIEQFGGKERLDRLPKPYVYAAEGGIHPEVAAEFFGFNSGEELLRAIESAPPKEDYIRQQTDARMKELHPDLLESQDFPEEAMKAIHNPSRAHVLRLELEHLASENLPVLKEVIRRVARRVPSEKAVREQATRIVGAQVVRDIKPIVYQRAEARFAKLAGEAVTKGDFDAAFEAKRKELLNHELYRAAVGAQETVAGALKSFKRIAQADEKLAKTRDIDLVNTARAVLAEFGLDRTDKSAAEYLEATKHYDPETYATVLSLLESATQNAAPYETVAYDDFVAMKDGVDAIWSLSKSTRQIEIDGKKMEIDQVKRELTDSISALAGDGGGDGYDRAATTWEKTKMGLLGIKSALRRVESWSEAMDGGPQGAFRKYVWNPVSEATAKYRIAKKDQIQKYLELVKPIEASLTHDEIIATELVSEESGKRKTKIFKGKAELLGALLHAGNESNLSKLVRGYGWGNFDIQGNTDFSRWDAFIRRMQATGVLTKADYDFVQGVWDLLEEMKPQAQAAHKEMYGHYFNEITAKEIVTPFGTYRGGYVPAVADPFRAPDANIRNERDALEKNNNSFMFPTAGRGFTKKRVENYAAPLAMNLSLVPGHIDKVLRFVHIEPAVKQVGRIVMDRKFRKVLDAFDPTVGGDMLVPWLQRAAQQKVSTASQGWGGKAADTFFRELRTRSGLQVMFGNVVNTMQQVTGFSIAAVKVKPKHLRNALFNYVRAPKVTTDDMNEKSEFMRTRMTTNVIEIQGQIDDMLLNPSKYEKARDFAKKHGYFMQSMSQNFVDVVTWSGAYDQAVEGGMTEKEAVRSADSAVRLTQGSMNAEDVSRFETGTPLQRAFTMFYSYFNMQANLQGTEFANAMRNLGLKKGAGRMLYVYALGMAIPAILSELLVQAASGRGLDDDDDDQYLEDLMRIFFSSQFRAVTALVPIAGPVVQAGVNRWNDKWYDDRISTSPAVSMIESTVGAPKSVYDAIAGEGSRKKAIRDGLTALGMVTGIPLAAFGRPLGYISDVQEGKVEPSGPVDFARGLVTGKAGKP